MQHLNASEIKPSPEKYSRGTSESSINSLNAQVDYKKSNTKTNPSEIDQTKSKIYQSASIRTVQLSSNASMVHKVEASKNSNRSIKTPEENCTCLLM